MIAGDAERADDDDAQAAVVQEAVADDQRQTDDSRDDAGSQLLAAQGGRDVVDLRHIEGQRQRAVLQARWPARWRTSG